MGPRQRFVVVAVAILVALLLLNGRAPAAHSLQAAPLAVGAATPLPGSMTIYTVSNPNTTTINVENVISNSDGFRYTFWSQVPPNGAIVLHLRDIAQIPTPFNGQIQLFADQPFTAQVTGFDYPTSTTPTATPLANNPPSLQVRVLLPLVQR